MFRVKQDASVSRGVMVDYKNIKLRAPIFFSKFNNTTSVKNFAIYCTLPMLYLKYTYIDIKSLAKRISINFYKMTSDIIFL